jgi:hypothetical protein
MVRNKPGSYLLNTNLTHCSTLNKLNYNIINIFEEVQVCFPYCRWPSIDPFGPKDCLCLLIFGCFDAEGIHTNINDLFCIDLIFMVWMQVPVEGEMSNSIVRHSLSLSMSTRCSFSEAIHSRDAWDPSLWHYLIFPTRCEHGEYEINNCLLHSCFHIQSRLYPFTTGGRY